MLIFYTFRRNMHLRNFLIFHFMASKSSKDELNDLSIKVTKLETEL